MKNLRILLLTGLLVMAVSCKREQARPSSTEEKTTAPSGPVAISLRAYGQTEWTQDARQPLWLAVTLSNPGAAKAASANHQAKLLQQAYQKKGLLDKMSPAQRRAFEEENKPREIPKLRLGSANVPLHGLVNFAMEGSDDKPVEIAVRPLANSLAGGPVLLENGETLDFDFGIDPAVLQGLPEGEYRIVAKLDPLSTRPLAESETGSEVRLTLKKQLPGLSRSEQDRRDYLYGRFHLADRQWSKAEECAQRLLGRDADSVSGLELRADALAGQGKNAQAAETFRKALNSFDAKFGRDPNMEEPKYLHFRLMELEKGKK